MIPISLLAIFLLSGCAPAEPPPDTIFAEPATERMQGTVRIVGSAPMNVQVVLQPQEGRSVRITGPLLPEIERLGGIVVALEGAISPSPDPMVNRQIEVTSYDIVSVDGEPVVMGEVLSISGSSAVLRTDQGREVTLTAVPSSFEVGQKVWVQGPGNVVVQTYGTIRP